MSMLINALFISFPVRHTANFRFDGRHNISYLMAHAMIRRFWQIRFYPRVNQSYRRKKPISPINEPQKLVFARVIYLGFGVSNRFLLSMARLKRLKNHMVWWNYPLTRGKTIFVRGFFFQHPVITNTSIFWTLLRSNAYEFVQHFVFSCQGKSRDVVYQRMYLFLWLIFAQQGRFEIQLSDYSALPRLTDLGIYYITRCGIRLLTRFHIPYIHFQRELRKVTSPKVYLSFFVQYSTYEKIQLNMSKHVR